MRDPGGKKRCTVWGAQQARLAWQGWGAAEQVISPGACSLNHRHKARGEISGDRMDFGSPDLLEVCLEPQDDVFSTGSFLDLGLHCPPPEAPVTRLQEQSLQGWESSGGHGCGLQESEPEDFPKFFIDPNEVYRSEASPGSDSGVSEDPGRPDSPPAPKAPSSPALYEVVYEAGALEGVQGEAGPAVGLISIQLDQWSPPFMVPEACMVSELPLDVCARMLPRAGAVNPVPPATLPQEVPVGTSPSPPGFRPLPASHFLLPCQALFLTDEEKRLLGQEGVSLPSHLPLTKAEERALKKVRRKIRNKQSAQDSRRRKKEYIDGLESRVAACSAQKRELQDKVRELERHHVSLVTQLRQLQTLITQTSNKAAQTSTCVLILLCSLALIILPSFSPFQGLTEAGPDDDQPHRVISRNILTHKDVTNQEIPVVESRLGGPPGAGGASGSASTRLGKVGGKPGPGGHGRAVLRADEM